MKAKYNKPETIASVLGLPFSYYERKKRDFIHKIRLECIGFFETNLEENLLNLGFKFKNKDELIEFCKERVSRIASTNSERIEFRLDYKNKDSPGELVGVFTNKIEMIDGVGIYKTIIG